MTLAELARGTGYRTNVDAYHLARFAAAGVRSVATLYDLGAGVGPVGLAVASAVPVRRLVLVERSVDAARLAQSNVAAGPMAQRAEVLRADVLEVARERPGDATLVVCNPPYVEPGRGRVPAAARAGARMGSITRFIEAARILLGRRGRACFVYPSHEVASLFAKLRERGLEPKRLTFVHARASEPARIALVQAQAGKAGGLVVTAPIVERARAGA